MKKRIILATNNEGKILEIKNILKNFSFQILSKKEAGIYEEIEEPYVTLEENSEAKAQYIHLKCPTDLVVADDTGLFIDALNGQPGVFSARFSGEHATDAANRKKVLQLLQNHKNRSAYFETVVTIMDSDGTIYHAKGKIRGNISTIEIGENGFGYDSIFIPENYSETFAQLDLEIKNKISHRSIALENAKKILKEILYETSSDC